MKKPLPTVLSGQERSGVYVYFSTQWALLPVSLPDPRLLTGGQSWKSPRNHFLPEETQTPEVRDLSKDHTFCEWWLLGSAHCASHRATVTVSERPLCFSPKARNFKKVELNFSHSF